MKKILFWQWDSFLAKGIELALNELHIEYDNFFYRLTDWEQDDAFMESLAKKLDEGSYEAVFSVNYNPLISLVCEKRNRRYLSWVYDCPLHIKNEEPMQLSCNEIFFFDRLQAQGYVAKGVHAHHLPLAADARVFSSCIGEIGNASCARKKQDTSFDEAKNQYHSLVEGEIDNASCEKKQHDSLDIEKFQHEITFVGQLYETEYAHYCSPLDEYLSGYLEGLVHAQQQVYGAYFLDEMLSEELLGKLNACYHKASGGKVTINKRELSYLLACEVTSRERRLLLSLLAKHFPVDLYTGSKTALPGVTKHDYVSYYTQMPQIFGGSKINLNISLKAIPSGIPLRVLDIMACGGFVLSNYQPELAEYFTDGENIAVYENAEDLVAKAKFYLAHDDIRKQIAENGKKVIEEQFDFKSRVQEIFCNSIN